jgi:hypothetical protein
MVGRRRHDPLNAAQLIFRIFFSCVGGKTQLTSVERHAMESILGGVGSVKLGLCVLCVSVLLSAVSTKTEA